MTFIIYLSGSLRYKSVTRTVTQSVTPTTKIKALIRAQNESNFTFQIFISAQSGLLF